MSVLLSSGKILQEHVSRKKKSCYSIKRYIFPLTVVLNSSEVRASCRRHSEILFYRNTQFWAFPWRKICSESVRPDSAICSLLKVMFRRLESPVQRQFKNLQTLLTLFCHVLKSTRGKMGINEMPKEITCISFSEEVYWWCDTYLVVSATFPMCVNCLEYVTHFWRRKETCPTYIFHIRL